MSRYMQEVRELIPVKVNPETLVTLTEAAELLGISVQGVAGAVNSGAFKTVIIDSSVPVRRGRRRLLRIEVMERAIQRVG